MLQKIDVSSQASISCWHLLTVYESISESRVLLDSAGWKGGRLSNQNLATGFHCCDALQTRVPPTLKGQGTKCNSLSSCKLQPLKMLPLHSLSSTGLPLPPFPLPYSVPWRLCSRKTTNEAAQDRAQHPCWVCLVELVTLLPKQFRSADWTKQTHVSRDVS